MTYRKKWVEALSNLMDDVPTFVEFRTTEHPEGIHVILDVTQEQMNQITEQLYGA